MQLKKTETVIKRVKYESLHPFIKKTDVNIKQTLTHVDTVKGHQYLNNEHSQQQTATVQSQAHNNTLHYLTSSHKTGNLQKHNGKIFNTRQTYLILTHPKSVQIIF
ncbi:hypothetical protein CDIK_2686 [Cucumispora dikerogammari]|nr:hypothetical protein CDIK_2686 [Cucumispora dikerogammari]